MRSGRQADAHLLVPDLRLLAEFAADTLVHHQIQSLDGYATVLNKRLVVLHGFFDDSLAAAFVGRVSEQTFTGADGKTRHCSVDAMRVRDG